MHLVTTPPTITVCSVCHTPVLAAVVAGLERHIDPTALVVDGMLAGLRGGLALFLLRGGTLYRLRPEHITGRPLIVLPEHVCRRPVPDHFIHDGDHMAVVIALVIRLLGPTPVAVEANDTPPY